MTYALPMAPPQRRERRRTVEHVLVQASTTLDRSDVDHVERVLTVCPIAPLEARPVTASPTDRLRLDGRSALVTGAGQGLGRAEALALAAAGASVVVNDYDEGAAKAVVGEIEAAGGTAVAAPGDVSQWSVAEDLVQAAVDSYGQLDVLVNNAGVLRDRLVFNISEEEWDTVIGVHLKGHAGTTRFATAHWRERSKAGETVDARVINTSSEAFLFGSPGQPNYAAAKAGITALTLSTAHACGRFGVKANALCPRARTAMTE